MVCLSSVARARLSASQLSASIRFVFSKILQSAFEIIITSRNRFYAIGGILFRSNSAFNAWLNRFWILVSFSKASTFNCRCTSLSKCPEIIFLPRRDGGTIVVGFRIVSTSITSISLTLSYLFTCIHVYMCESINVRSEDRLQIYFFPRNGVGYLDVGHVGFS